MIPVRFAFSLDTHQISLVRGITTSLSHLFPDPPSLNVGMSARREGCRLLNGVHCWWPRPPLLEVALAMDASSFVIYSKTDGSNILGLSLLTDTGRIGLQGKTCSSTLPPNRLENQFHRHGRTRPLLMETWIPVPFLERLFGLTGKKMFLDGSRMI